MGPKILAIVFLIHSALSDRGNSIEYYWRVYDLHKIPIDAVIAGQDLSQNNLFVGQTYIWAHAGIHTTTISPGNEIWAPYGGPRHATNFVQILCSKATERFSWIPATSDKLHLVGLDTHIVLGGLDQNRRTYIGRVKHQGNIVIGKVYTHDINNSVMVFIFNNREYRVKSYEVLVYNGTVSKCRTLCCTTAQLQKKSKSTNFCGNVSYLCEFEEN